MSLDKMTKRHHQLDTMMEIHDNKLIELFEKNCL